MAPDAGAGDWLRLAFAPGLGAARARVLLEAFGNATAIFGIDLETKSRSRESHRARLGALCGPAAADELLGRPGLAIVGSRNATRQGARNAADFAAHLGRAGLVIISGLAAGIDAAAHEGALAAGAGTIALLGTGIDIAYPPGNAALTARIAAEGLLLSELPPGAGPIAFHFPRRNRLIAALARGVLVVEAAPQSGSLITARLAADLGREVFAIPGSIHSPLSRGCHQLLRDGAKLVETARDVLEELRWPQSPTPARSASGVAAGGGALMDALGHDPADVDTLAARLGQDAGTVAALLLELELDQRVERLPGNRYQRLSG